MLPIHLAIGIIEGLATAFVLAFVWSAQAGTAWRGDRRVIHGQTQAGRRDARNDAVAGDGCVLVCLDSTRRSGVVD